MSTGNNDLRSSAVSSAESGPIRNNDVRSSAVSSAESGPNTPVRFLDAILKLENGGTLQRLVLSAVRQDAGRAELFVKEALNGMKPEDIGKDSDFDEIICDKVKGALKSSQTPAKKRKPTGGPEDDDDTATTHEKRKTKTVPFPVSDDNLEPTQKTENQKTLEHLVQGTPITGDARKCFVLQMTGFLAILSVLNTCRDTIKKHLEQGSLIEGTDYEINEDDGSVKFFEEDPSDEPAK